MSFVFIRPWWLLALIPSVIIVLLLLKHRSAHHVWRGIVAEHLTPYVVAQPAVTRGAQPQILLGLVLVITCLSLAGPAWVREPVPFAEDEAALVIVLEVSPTMLARDIQPSRLQRATQKIRDLLEKRKGSPSALIAYSGTAHLVMPLTDDGELIADFAAELDPEIMPLAGDVADKALALARKQLLDSARSGSILWVTDGVSPATLSQIQSSKDEVKIHLYAIAGGKEVVVPVDSPPAPPLDKTSLQAAADAGGGSLVVVTPDASDVERLASIVESRITRATSNAEEGQRWLDFGYWLLPLLAVLVLFWFRPGWGVRYD